MDVLVLTHAIYWLFGALAVLSLLIIARKASEGMTWLWFFHPHLMTAVNCAYFIAIPVYVLTCVAVAVLSGMVMYATGYALALCVVISILIAIALPFLMLLAVVICISAIVLLGTGLAYLGIWIYYSIQGEIMKIRLHRTERKKAKEKKKAQKNKQTE